MEKIIFFNGNTDKATFDKKKVYFKFLDYAFEKTDFFMLVYVNYYNKGYTKIMKQFKEKLDKYKVKCRNNPSWPGTLNTHCTDTTYKIIFYKNTSETKEILKQVPYFNSWSCPSYPQDLAFFKGNICWFYSVGHENISAVLHATDDDVEFIESLGLAKKSDAYYPKDNYYNSFDEDLVGFSRT